MIYQPFYNLILIPTSLVIAEAEVLPEADKPPDEKYSGMEKIPLLVMSDNASSLQHFSIKGNQQSVSFTHTDDNSYKETRVQHGI